jgi:tetratricopeptide (TPR) repeat protein
MSAENVDRPKRVFISATTHDLQSYRKLVTSWAKSKGYIPVVQEDFPAYPHDYSVKDVLRENLSSCDAVIHLAGLYYGAEPTGYVSPESRRSYTQLEYDLAKILRRQLFVLIASEDYEPDEPITNQSQDHYQFQRQHRQRIRDSGGMRYPFSNHEQLSQQLQKIEVTGVADRPNNLPVVGSLFKGRDDFLLNLRSKVEGKVGSALVIATKHTIHGLGGIGKTRLAIEYANRYSEHYTALLFVVADSPEGLRANIANLCGALRIDEPEPAKQYGAAIKWLQEHPGWLLIVDSVDTQEAAKAVEESILSKLQEGHIVVTSRLSTWKNRDLDLLELNVISQEASVELLIEGTKGRRKENASEKEDVNNLAKRLGFLPLALQQAIGFIMTRRCSFADYLRRWEETDTKVIEWHDKFELNYPRSIATTWEMSFEELRPAGKDLLRMICWLAPNPIPRSLFDMVPHQPNPIDVEDGIAELEKYSFLRWVDDDADFVQVHGLVSEIARYRMSEQERLKSLYETLDKSILFFGSFDLEDVSKMRSLFHPCRSHLKKLIVHSTSFGFLEKTSFFMRKLGRYLISVAEFSDAETLLRSALRIEENLQRTDHVVLASVLNDLAALLCETDRFSEAETVYCRSISILETCCGQDGLAIATVRSNLAITILKSDRFRSVEQLLRGSLHIAELTNYGNHPVVCGMLNNLALLLLETNRHDEAESLLRRALELSEFLWGPSHPNTSKILNNLGGLFRDIDRKTEAILVLRRAIKIDEDSFSPEHLNVAYGLVTLADVLERSNNSSDAEILARKAIGIFEKSFDQKHSGLAEAMSVLARSLTRQTRYEEAEAFFRRALQINEMIFGEESKEIGSTLNSLAQLLHQTKSLAESEKLFRRALSMYERIYGAEHSNVAICLENLALLLRDLGCYEEAIPMFRRALRIEESTYGPTHPYTARALNGLASMLAETNLQIDAEFMLRRSLQIHGFYRCIGEFDDLGFQVVQSNYCAVLSSLGFSHTQIEAKLAEIEQEAQKAAAILPDLNP